MFNLDRTPMADYTNMYNNSITESLEQHVCNENDKFPIKQCFLTEIKTEVESKLPLENNKKRVDQHLKEHNYFLTDKNIVDYNKNINRSLKDHNYCIAKKNCTDNNKRKNYQHFIDHNYVFPVSKENYLPVQDGETVTDGPLQIATTYSIIPGVRLNSQVYMDNLHHRYYKHSNQNKKIYLVCVNQKNREPFCPVTALISSDVNDNSIKTTGTHNHLPQPVDVPMIFLRSAIGLQATHSDSISKSTRQLYNQETIMNPEGAKSYTLVQSQLRIRRMRRLRRKSNRFNFRINLE